jgi:selenoprotein W-related protein
MSDVAIEYCVPCGHLPRASDLAEHLLQTFGQDVDRVSLVTGDNGVFVVTVDDEVVFDKSEDSFDVDAITRAVRSNL